MSHEAAMLTFVIASPAALEAEGQRLLASHAAMMATSHHRSGEFALLHYNVAKTPEHDGTVTFVVNQVYEHRAGLDDHLARREEWDDIHGFNAWLSECQVTAVLDGEVLHALP